LAITLAVTVLLHTPARAALTTESLEHIEAAVVRFVEQQYPSTNSDRASANLRVTVGRLDQRLRLTQCHKALESEWAPGSASVGQATVTVRCTGARPWKLYVPVRVALQQLVVVTARPMSRGERIGRGDLVLEKRALVQHRGGVIRDPDQIQGYVLKYAVAAGKVLTPRMLNAPKLVQRGNRVIVIAASQGLNIQMKGIALEDGLIGDSIKVRNPVSKRVLLGIVTATGTVHTSAP